MKDARSASAASAATRLDALAQLLLCGLAGGLLLVPPWLFGGNGAAGYAWIVWTGRACVLPLGLWIAARGLKREPLGAGFWLAVFCWSLLASQVVASLFNRSSVLQAPWLGDGFERLPHLAALPSTAFRPATEIEGWLWLSLGLIALTARCVGLSDRAGAALLALLAGNATVLAIVGLPFKFSGEKLILGHWPAPEWYFYATFLYHNHWCAFAVLAIAALAGLVTRHHAVRTRFLLALCAGIIAGSAFLSVSLLGTLTIVVLAGALCVDFIRHRPPTPSYRPRFSYFLAAACGVILMLVTAKGVAQVVQRPGGQRTWSRILGDNPFYLRESLAEDTLQMVVDKPWFGWGLGAYPAAFRFYQRPETRIVHNEGRITLYEHAHDDWLERLAELGGVGLCLLIAPGVFWIYRARSKLAAGGLRRCVVGGCLAALAMACGDMVFVNQSVAAIFAFLLGWGTFL
jgi:O-antigen ligase